MEAGGKKLVTALHFRSPRFGSVLELGARSFTPTEGTMPLATTILHQNVLEDGLTDAPNAVGFSPEFRHAFKVLLWGLGGHSLQLSRRHKSLQSPSPRIDGLRVASGGHKGHEGHEGHKSHKGRKTLQSPSPPY